MTSEPQPLTSDRRRLRRLPTSEPKSNTARRRTAPPHAAAVAIAVEKPLIAQLQESDVMRTLGGNPGQQRHPSI